MLNAWLRIILCRRLRDGNSCLKDESKGDILEDTKSINVRNWKKVAQNRDGWKKVVEQARTLCRL